ncbi:hypothetical protein LAZ67_1005770 [Cordylochernes scorpioides]|uniref:G-protein coupled receptors family 1 profile domain-containing protein n=1 Tax=Cordylochernes scorpioides TaxID=51811 RepID=A0ABY6K1X4_9ARAC|nr:hypothetical protein LAZ67_1005770 [Cordylochernes scorpioides]
MALFLIASIHTLMHIAIHKYLSITRRFNRRSRPLRVKLMLIGAWLWAGLCAAFPLMGWSQTVYKAGASQCGPALPSKLPDYLHSLLINSTNYVLPLVVMTFCYVRIFREIHLHMQKRQSRAVEQQKRIAVTLLLVVICFVVCWTPYIVYSVTAGAMKNKEALPLIFNPIFAANMSTDLRIPGEESLLRSINQSTLFCNPSLEHPILAYMCGYLNSACNPLIYAFRSPSFRKGYREILCFGRGASMEPYHNPKVQEQIA